MPNVITLALPLRIRVEPALIPHYSDRSTPNMTRIYYRADENGVSIVLGDVHSAATEQYLIFDNPPTGIPLIFYATLLNNFGEGPPSPEIRLTLDAPPPAPHPPTARRMNDDSVIVHISLPTLSSGCSKITVALVSYYEKQSPTQRHTLKCVDIDSLTVVASGLNVDSFYIFTAQVHNSSGWSEPSECCEPFCIARMMKPCAKPTVNILGPRSVKVSLDSQPDNIFGFKVYASMLQESSLNQCVHLATYYAPAHKRKLKTSSVSRLNYLGNKSSQNSPAGSLSLLAGSHSSTSEAPWSIIVDNLDYGCEYFISTVLFIEKEHSSPSEAIKVLLAAAIKLPMSPDLVKPVSLKRIKQVEQKKTSKWPSTTQSRRNDGKLKYDNVSRTEITKIAQSTPNMVGAKRTVLPNARIAASIKIQNTQKFTKI